MKDLRVSLVQSDIVWQSPSVNLSKYADKLALLKDRTDLIILPEMFSTGFTMEASDSINLDVSRGYVSGV